MDYIETHKFGGTSLANASRFRNAAHLLPSTPTVVVVSAIHQITNQLEKAIDCAIAGTPISSLLNNIKKTHLNIIAELNLDSAQLLLEHIHNDFNTIKTVLTSIKVVKHCSTAERAEILGLGERCSAQIMNTLIMQSRTSQYLDASSLLFTETQNGIQTFDLPRTRLALDDLLAQNTTDVIVITGFLARDITGHKTLLERNGSDVSASVFAELFNCKKLIIWSDRDGIYTSDPNIVTQAFPIDSMSYEEALELAYFGTTIIHPQTIAPAKRAGRAIHIRNALNPSSNGTRISHQGTTNRHHVRGLTSINEIALITIEGTGMLGIAGISARAFNALSDSNISVILISQASSEHSICLCVKSNEGEKAQTVLLRCFGYEINHDAINKISLETDNAIVAVVGDQMANQIGIAGKLCSTLANARVNIRAIAQGASERNISIVIKQPDLNKALKSLHSGFYLGAKTIAIGMIGTGLIGTEFLNQLEKTIAKLFEKEQICFHLRAVMNSRSMLLAEKHIPLSDWETQFKQSVDKPDIDQYLQHMNCDSYPHSVIIDCTASSDIALHYPQFIEFGMHIITPNKQANSGDINQYHLIRKNAKKNNRQFLYETTVCAGLPIISTLKDIINTGDTVLQIQGVVSGSLNYIFTQLNQQHPFSRSVLNAKELGYTEPDPREDLSGRDVARKIVTLARELNMDISLESLEFQSLVPEALEDVSVIEFLERLPEFDHYFQDRLKELQSPHSILSYTGKINTETGNVSVGIEAITKNHPLSSLEGTDNMIIFKTERYKEQPLMVRGPGAGAAVTASGIFADLLRLTSSLSS